MGWLGETMNSSWMFCSSLLVHGSGALMLAYGESFSFLSASALVYGTGSVLGIVSSSSVIIETCADDSLRTRVISLCYASTAIGYAISFFLGTWMYETLGHRVVFASVSAVFLLTLVAFVTTSCRSLKSLTSTDYRDEEIVRAVQEPEQTSSVASPSTGHDVVRKRTYCQFLTDPIAILASCQVVLVYSGLSTAAATAPARLQRKFGVSIGANGSILGVSSVIDSFILLLVTIFVNTNRKSWICLMTFVLIQSLGFLVYPFIQHPTEAMGPETCIRSAKAVIMALAPSLMFRIVDARNVGTYSQASALYVVLKHGGQILGSFTSPSLIDAFGFDNVYFTMSAMFAMVAVASVSYAKLS